VPKKLQVLLIQKSQVRIILRMKVIKKHTLFRLKRSTTVFSVMNFLAIFKIALG